MSSVEGLEVRLPNLLARDLGKGTHAIVTMIFECVVILQRFAAKALTVTTARSTTRVSANLAIFFIFR